MKVKAVYHHQIRTITCVGLDVSEMTVNHETFSYKAIPLFVGYIIRTALKRVPLRPSLLRRGRQKDVDTKPRKCDLL